MVMDDSHTPKDDGLLHANGEQQQTSVDCDVHEGQDHYEHHNGSTMKDLSDMIYMKEGYDDEDDSDSDWEPVNPPMPQRWYCMNCMMSNVDDAHHCLGCGEYKNSGILSHGCFASSLGEGVDDSIGLNVTVKLDEGVESATAIGFDERMLLHYEMEMKSHPHPERPDRIQAIAASFSACGIFPGKCLQLPAREISEEELNLVHSLDNIEAIRCTKHMFSSYFTPDTYANKHSACAARLAAGFCSDLAIAIMSGKARNGFALVRPPGHHAGVNQAMGFCLHNNAAVATKAAQSAGAKKVLIVDWDVHHGNGTQEIFDGDKSVLYISLHRHEKGTFYPGTGAADEIGTSSGVGYSVNIPWKTGGVGDNDYVYAFQNIILPIALEFTPDLTIISAGFDAARGDPLGGCDVTPTGYAQMTEMLCGLSQGRLLVILEGGYNLRSISSSATAVVKVLLGEIPEKKGNAVVPSKAGLQTFMEVVRIQSKFWPILESSHIKLKALWEQMALSKRKKHGKRKHPRGSVCWKWGNKSFMYRLLYSGMRMKLHGHGRKISCSLTL